MKLELGMALVSLEGESLLDGNLVVTLRHILVNALNTPVSEESGEKVAWKCPKCGFVSKRSVPVDAEEKRRRYHLSQKIWEAEKTIDLLAEDVALMKQLVHKAFPSPLIVGQILDILDPISV